MTAPNGGAGALDLVVRGRLEPKGVGPLVEAARGEPSDVPFVVVSRYLSEATRARLRERGAGYLDLTGNIRIVVAQPGLFLETQGAAEDTNKKQRPTRTLRGAKTGRIVRALVDRRQAPRVRELAAATGIDAGYVSRVLTFLDAEALVTRSARGRLETVDWPALLRRWAEAAPLDVRGRPFSYLEPRGLPALVARFANSDARYAITAGLAAAAFAPTAAGRLAIVWVRDAEQVAQRLGLRPVEAGANVLLLEPRDDGVFEGAAQRDGAWYAAPSQITADLLTSPGRGPAEGEEMLAWMRAHEEVWRR